MKKIFYFYMQGCYHCNAINGFIAKGELEGIIPVDLAMFFNVSTAKRYGVLDAPTFVIVDESDNIIKKTDGYFEKDLATLRNILYDEPMPEVIVPEEATVLEDESTEL